MPWTKKTTGVAADLATLIMCDGSNSNKLTDFGLSGCVEGAGITLDTANVVKVDHTSDGWGWTVYTNDVSFVPGTITFSDVGNGKPRWLDSNAADGTVIMLAHFRSGDVWGNRELLKLTDPNNPMIRNDASNIGQIGASAYTTIVTDATTAWPADTAIGLGMNARRSSTAFWKYFYGRKAGGTFAQEGSTGSIADAGGQTTIDKLGFNAQAGSVEMELFLIAVCPTRFLTGPEMNAILSDPIGTLINTGGGAAPSEGISDAAQSRNRPGRGPFSKSRFYVRLPDAINAPLTGAALAAAALAETSVTAAVSTAIRLAASAAASTTITSPLTSQITFGASAAVIGSGAAGLSASIAFLATAAGEAAAIAALGSGIALAASSAALVNASAPLSSGIRLTAAAGSLVSFSAQFGAIPAALVASAAGNVSTVAQLTSGIPLAGAATAVTSLTPALSSGVMLTASGQSIVGVAAVLASAAGGGMAASFSMRASSIASLSTGIALASQALGEVSFAAGESPPLVLTVQRYIVTRQGKMRLIASAQSTSRLIH